MQRNGSVFLRWGVEVGPYVQRHDDWVRRDADGTVQEGSRAYRNGELVE